MRTLPNPLHPRRSADAGVLLRGFAVLLAAVALLALDAPLTGAADHPPVPVARAGVATSATCLQCHDGMIARDAPTRDVRMASLPGPAAIRPPERGDHMGHPIGIEYARAALRRNARLHPRASLDPVLRLEDGHVGCVTCHDLASSRPAKVVQPARGGLCMACHDL